MYVCANVHYLRSKMSFLADRKPFMGFSGGSKTLHGFFWRIENPARVSRLRKRTLFEIQNEFPGRSKPPHGFFWRIENPARVSRLRKRTLFEIQNEFPGRSK